MIEDADFLGEPQRRIQRQQIDQGSKPHTLGDAGERAEPDAGHRHGVERRSMMFSNMQAVESGLVGRLRKGQALVILRRQRPVARHIDMVENAKLHFFRPS